MKKLFVTIFILAIPSLAAAQESTPRGWGYVFGGIGGRTGGFDSETTVHIGGGAEGRIYKGLGLGTEIGYLSSTNGGSSFGLFSTNVAYHFTGLSRNQKLVPFITGGGSIAITSGAHGGGNFGGGVQYWMKPRLGLRFEFRDHIFSSDSPHFYGFRVGLSFH